MRVMMKVNIPVEAGNAAAREGTLARRIQAILEDLEPEAAYFTDNEGQRAAFLFLHLKDSSEIPRIAEPWFHSFDARVEIHPVMAPEDLEKAAPYLEHAVSQYA